MANSTIEYNHYKWTCWLIHYVHGYSLPFHCIYAVFCCDLQYLFWTESDDVCDYYHCTHLMTCCWIWVIRVSLFFGHTQWFMAFCKWTIDYLFTSDCQKIFTIFYVALPQHIRQTKIWNKGTRLLEGSLLLIHLYISLQWRHNESDGVSNHRRIDCLLQHLFRRRSKKTPKHRVTGFVTGEFLTQRASNAENVFISWRHHVNTMGQSAVGTWVSVKLL